MFPSITAVIPTLNSERTLRSCLESLSTQDYPQDYLEIIIVDGGSQDSTRQIAAAFGAVFIEEPGMKENPEARKAIGAARATNELILFVDSDNILPHKNWLKNMIEPLVNDREIIATQPLRYHYDKNLSLLNRYFSLFGVNDPIAYYFNKRDRLSWQEQDWRLFGSAEDKGRYFKVTFRKDRLPTLGANGYLVRKDILFKARTNPEEFFHIDINYDLVVLGYNKYGIVKDDIIHLTADK